MTEHYDFLISRVQKNSITNVTKMKTDIQYKLSTGIARHSQQFFS